MREPVHRPGRQDLFAENASDKCSNSKSFVMTIAFFGYASKVLQADNGTEFTDRSFAKPGGRYSREGPASWMRFAKARHRQQAHTA